MKAKTGVKAGRLASNHNEAMATAKRGVRVRTMIKAGKKRK